MDYEVWNQSYISLSHGAERFTLRLIHYQHFNEFNRLDKEWFRIMPQNFDYHREGSEQLFGFGKTPEQAMRKLLESAKRVSGRS